MVPLTLIVIVLAIRLAISPGRNPILFAWSAMAAFLFLSVIALMILTTTGSHAAARSALVQSNDWTCDACGVFVPAAVAARRVCLLCGVRKSSLDLAQERQDRLFWANVDVARDCAGEPGTVKRQGPNIVWHSGNADPLPMLREEFQTSHRRFEALVGETEIVDPLLRILCFHNRDGLLRFDKKKLYALDFSGEPSKDLERPQKAIVLCVGDVAGQIDARQSAGLLYHEALLDQILGRAAVPWLRTGIARTLASAGQHDVVVELNRRMAASLSAGVAWSENLFSPSFTKVFRVRLWRNHQISVQRSEQFNDQAWSIVLYLAGDQAPDARKAAFRTFVKDTRLKSHHAEAFLQHFGFGFSTLLEDWRQWVIDQELLTDKPHLPEASFDHLQDKHQPAT